MSLIYFIEQHAEYAPVLRPVFRLIDDGEVEAHASVISLIEVLVRPFALGQTDLASEYRDLLLNSRNLVLHPVDAEVATLSATIRAQHGLKVPDALVAATGIANECDCLVTNDPAFNRLNGIRVLLLSDFE
jgi:predicted nucleic acid-binding protein